MTFRHYFVEVLAAGSQFLNALTAGNRDQTFSSRLGEARTKHKWRWYPAYWTINTFAYIWRWIVGRVLGWRAGVDWPKNHCIEAWLNGDEEHTYP